MDNMKLLALKNERLIFLKEQLRRFSYYGKTKEVHEVSVNIRNLEKSIKELE